MIWVYIGAIVLAVVLLAVAFYMIGVGHGQSGKVKFVSPSEARQMRERQRNESLVNAVRQVFDEATGKMNRTAHDHRDGLW